jgi:hypothetical protein
MAIWYILRPFGLLKDPFVYFVVFWYIFPRIGNPGLDFFDFFPPMFCGREKIGQKINRISFSDIFL